MRQRPRPRRVRSLIRRAALARTIKRAEREEQKREG